MLKDFIRYFSIGIINTIIHWFVFIFVFYFYPSQAISNFIGFGIAVTCSFFLNSRYTFQATPSLNKYLLFIFFMGGLNFLIGWKAQYISLSPIFTMMLSSGISLTLGFLYSKLIVFSKINK